MATAMADETGSAVAVVVTVAMVVADNNRNCGGRQQSITCGSGSGRDSGHSSGDHGSTLQWQAGTVAQQKRQQ
jgi:hypothetical protein